MGAPSGRSTNLGPMARGDLRDEVHEQVKASVRAGADCVLGGTIPDQPGAWYPPTVLTGVKKGMPAFEEEIFGPVAAIMTAYNEDLAFKFSNDTRYVLGVELIANELVNDQIIADVTHTV